MKRPPISDAQMDLLGERLGRRRRGPPRLPQGRGRPGRAGRGRLQRPPGVGGAQARPRREARQGAAPPHRRRRLVAERSVEPRLQQGSLLHRRARALGRPHEVHRRLRAGALRGEQGRRRTRTARCGRSPSARTRSGRTAARAPREDFEWSWKRQLDPASSALLELPLRHQERRGVQQEAGDRRLRGRRAGQGRLDAGGHPGGAARLLPGALRLPGRAARPTGRPSRSTATSGRRPPTSCATGPSCWRRGSTTRSWCSGRTSTSSAPRT